MPERSTEDHIRSARRRLRAAAISYSEIRDREYSAKFLQLADVSALLWNAGIDVVSALMIGDGHDRLGTSRNRSRYVNQRLHDMNPELRLRITWRYFAMLHNFQHNLDLPQERFAISCQYTAELFGSLNGLLPDTLQLPRESFAWLYEIR